MFNLSAFTAVHTGLSLIALVAGLLLVLGLIRGQTLGTTAALYFVTSVLTSATGFGFPFTHFLPSHGVGILSLLALAVALYARYSAHLAGAWRRSYVVATSISVFFLVFVTVAQAFAKVPELHALAPTQAEPPFAVAEGAVLLLFIVLTVMALKGLRNSTTLS